MTRPMPSATVPTLQSSSSLPVSGFNRFWQDPAARNARESLLSQLDKSSLLNLRLTARTCTKPASPHVFKEITVTFKSTTFTKPARLAALSRIGQYVRRLTFKMPHGDATFLPPLLEPTTGSEVEYVYTPNCSPLKSKPSRTLVSGQIQPCETNEGAKELSDLLVKQYPPLYHAACNVPSFVRAFAQLPNLRYLTVTCPNEDTKQSGGASAFGPGMLPTASKSIVDHALVSLRIAIERNSLPKLDHLTLSPVQAHAIQYLNPLLGLGARPNSVRRWRQIRYLTIHMPVTNSAAQLKILHAYIGVFAPTLKSFVFHWLPGPVRPSSAGNASKRAPIGAQLPIRPSSTGTSYFPRVITPQASSLSDRAEHGSDSSLGAHRGANPLTLHESAFLTQDDGSFNTKRDPNPKAKPTTIPISTPREKASSSSLDSMQSMTSASTLDDDRTPTPTPTGTPTRRPRLRCQPTNTFSTAIRPSSSSSPTSPTSPSSLRPLHLPHLTYFELDSILTTSTEIATFIRAHGTHLSEFKFEATTLASGDWDAALAPLTELAGGCDRWKREARREEEVPICLGPELSPLDGLMDFGAGKMMLVDEVGCQGLVVDEALGRKKGFGRSPWMGGKSPLLGMKMGMGRPRVEVLPGGCAREAAMGMGAGVGMGMGMGWEKRRVKKGAKLMGGGQKALEDGVRKLLAQTVFPWF